MRDRTRARDPHSDPLHLVSRQLLLIVEGHMRRPIRPKVVRVSAVVLCVVVSSACWWGRGGRDARRGGGDGHEEHHDEGHDEHR